MKTFLPAFSVFTPTTLNEALDAMASDVEYRPLAGGTDVMVYMESGALPAAVFINLTSIPELKRPLTVNGSLSLSALTTYQETRSSLDIQREFPMLIRAAREVGVVAIQNVATWAGNVANASPAADGVPALMAYDAVLDIAGKNRSRKVSLADFYKGYKQMDLERSELIVGITAPLPPQGRREYFRKVGTRRLQAISKVLLAGWVQMDGNLIKDIRLIFGSVAPVTLRARATEAVLRGKEITPKVINEACASIQSEINPIDDIRSNQKYRRTVAENLLRDFLQPENRS